MTIAELKRDARTRFDLTDPEHQSSLTRLADALLASPELEATDLAALAREEGRRSSSGSRPSWSTRAAG
jgi:hypothetical protein